MINSQSGQMSAPVKITLITVVKNGERFVGQTIKSVVEQSYRAIEYIVIDGASTDGTVDIIRAYESRLSKWVSEPDKGIADAFNKGLALATGDYVMFLNSDDALANREVVGTVVQKIIQHNFPRLIYGDYDVLSRDAGAFLYRGSVKIARGGLLRGQMLPHPCLFASRASFEKYGNFDLSFKVAMDYEWMLRGVLGERATHLPIPISEIRDGGVSTLDRDLAVQEIIRALKKNKYISSPWGEIGLRGYFLLRALVRAGLTYVGAYEVFDRLRKR